MWFELLFLWIYSSQTDFLGKFGNLTICGGNRLLATMTQYSFSESCQNKCLRQKDGKISAGSFPFLHAYHLYKL